MQYVPVIGLEIHVQLKTKSKMFCSCDNNTDLFGFREPESGSRNPNTAVCPVCMGHPGVLPVPNSQAIEYAVLAALSLNCQILDFSKFDRKNYFYPDLPKGYQISQFDQPIGVGGYLDIETEKQRNIETQIEQTVRFPESNKPTGVKLRSQLRRVAITRVHLEEDAAKLFHIAGLPSVDNAVLMHNAGASRNADHPHQTTPSSGGGGVVGEGQRFTEGNSVVSDLSADLSAEALAEEEASAEAEGHSVFSERKTAFTYVDFNRSGTPLLEIVTEPDFRSPQEAKIFLQELRLIMRYLGVSSADMEKGHLRCDANISLMPLSAYSEFFDTAKDGLIAGLPPVDNAVLTHDAGASRNADSVLPEGNSVVSGGHSVFSERKTALVLNPKTEIKNLNSFKAVERALEYEILRQTKLFNEGKPPSVETTRGWNDAQGITEEQRTKEGSSDYRYFPEPDIPPLNLIEIAARIKGQTSPTPPLPLPKGEVPKSFSTTGIPVPRPQAGMAAEGLATESLGSREGEEQRFTEGNSVVSREGHSVASNKTPAFIGIPELPIAKRQRFADEYGFTPADAKILTDDINVANYVEKVMSELYEWLKTQPEAVESPNHTEQNTEQKHGTTQNLQSDGVAHESARKNQDERTLSCANPHDFKGVAHESARKNQDERTLSCANPHDFKGVAHESARKNLPCSSVLARIVSTWFITKLFGLMSEHKIDIRILKISPENFAEFLTLIYQNQLSSSSALIVLEEMLLTGGDPSQIMEEKRLGKMDDEERLAEIIQNIIKNNPKQVAEYKSGKIQLLQFLIGMVMKETEGRADAKVARKILEKYLK